MDFQLKIKNRKGETRDLKWMPVDMTQELVYTEIQRMRPDQKYFCEKNLDKIRKGKKADYTHINAVYLEKFYRKLDVCVDNFIRNQRRRGKKS